ncbi:MmcQ/YjbR family DNA-binding protein [Rufibacter roseus]|uniref:MmcQ/YjbR family DNA-binding protein n=1 Tax=Rufibacter roseus TaxID=1567108 RepID=A0ABW2DNT2_9BACT|nr:MmcQ/YjbR family DNA-binding protein [Rufibacter roseus]
MNIEELRALCLSMPAVTEDVKWDNDLCFSVGGKMFCVASLEPPFSFSFKVTDAEFDRLVELTNIVPAPYLARYKWVMAKKGHPLTSIEIEKMLWSSYTLIKSKLSKKQWQAALQNAG